jgi:hypothetical protein
MARQVLALINSEPTEPCQEIYALVSDAEWTDRTTATASTMSMAIDAQGE